MSRAARIERLLDSLDPVACAEDGPVRLILRMHLAEAKMDSAPALGTIATMKETTTMAAKKLVKKNIKRNVGKTTGKVTRKSLGTAAPRVATKRTAKRRVAKKPVKKPKGY